jgi:hypothetical protein
VLTARAGPLFDERQPIEGRAKLSLRRGERQPPSEGLASRQPPRLFGRRQGRAGVRRDRPVRGAGGFVDEFGAGLEAAVDQARCA